MTESAQITLQPMEMDHIARAHAMSQAVSWPHRPEDWALVLGVSKGVVALRGDQVVGTGMLSLLGDVGTLNMIIVDAAMRGQGLGRKLMQSLMEQAGALELRLVATADGLPLYEKLGFKAVGQVAQYQGIARAPEDGAPVQEVHDANPEEIARLVAADSAATGMSRANLLHQIAEQGDVIATRGGLAMIRPFGRGYVIGPVLAQDDAAACALLSEAARRYAGDFLRVDFAPDRALAAHAERLGLSHVGGGVAMTRHTGAAVTPAEPEFKTYALVSQALG